MNTAPFKSGDLVTFETDEDFAFVKQKVVGFEFHMEVTRDSVFRVRTTWPSRTLRNSGIWALELLELPSFSFKATRFKAIQLPKYHRIIQKIKEMEEKRKENGYAF